MDHNILDVSLVEGMQTMQLFSKETNLDGLDNLATIPASPAVYAICGRVNGKPANPRFVGATMNLREAVIAHFGDDEKDSCLQAFLHSIKLKDLVFEIISEPSPAVLEAKAGQWKETLKPVCNEIINKVY